MDRPVSTQNGARNFKSPSYCLLCKRSNDQLIEGTPRNLQSTPAPAKEKTKPAQGPPEVQTLVTELKAEVAEMQINETASCSRSSLDESMGGFNILVGVTGSVAALKLPLLVTELLQLSGVDVRVVTTEHAKHFYNPADVLVKIYSDSDEWELWTHRSDPVLHIELRCWAHLFIIAPLDANTLAKVANGICDNLLTCVVRAWDMSRPLLFCPAMNTAMWNHPITAEHVSKLGAFGYIEIPCISKKLVCGDEGKGAMAEVSTIISAIEQYILHQPNEPKNT